LFESYGAFPHCERSHQIEEVPGKEEQMKHPNDAELALHAGGDLGWLRQKLTARHVRNCDACQATVVEFSALRSNVRELPDLPWNRMALEMTANIRLGLEAGECVSARPTSGEGRDWNATRLSSRSFWGAGMREVSWPRLALACLVLFAMAGVAYIVQHPLPGMLPGVMSSGPAAGTVLEASENGLQVNEAGQTLRLLNTSGSAVSRSVGSRGELGARYLDSNGYVTISQVYGQ
jgi:hypothetical protein